VESVRNVLLKYYYLFYGVKKSEKLLLNIEIRGLQRSFSYEIHLIFFQRFYHIWEVTRQTFPSAPPKGWILVAHDVLRPRYDKHELEMSNFREIFVNVWTEEANFLAPLVQNKVKNVKFHMLRKKKVRFYLTLVRKKDFCSSILSAS